MCIYSCTPDSTGRFATSGVTLLEGARGQGTAGCPIDGFHVTSYQNQFCRSSHTRLPCWFPLCTEKCLHTVQKIEARNARKPCGAWGLGGEALESSCVFQCRNSIFNPFQCKLIKIVNGSQLAKLNKSITCMSLT